MKTARPNVSYISQKDIQLSTRYITTDLIYACESEGGGKELLFVDGSMKTFNLTGNVIYYNTNLNTITVSWSSLLMPLL